MLLNEEEKTILDELYQTLKSVYLCGQYLCQTDTTIHKAW